MADKQPKKITPPYATAAGLRLFFAKLKSVRPIGQLTKKWVEDNEIPFPDAIVSTMKFLGAIDQDANLTPAFSSLRLDGEPFQEALATLVRTGYGPIFDQIEDVETVSERDLGNAFKTAYDVGAPARYATPFLTLAELAGLRRAPTSATRGAAQGATRTVRATPSRGGTNPSPTRGGSTAGTKGHQEDAPRNGPDVQIVLRLDVPWDANPDDIRARVDALRSLAKVETT